MKKKTIVSLIGCTFALAFGAFVGIKLGQNKIKEVRADGTYTGSIIVKKNDNDMKYTGSKLVAHFFDDENPQHTGWGDAVWNDGHTYQKYSWSLDFEPTKIIMLRVNGDSWDSSDPWSNIWCRTGNVSLSGADVLWMAGNSSESGNHGTFSTETFVMNDSDLQIAELTEEKVRADGEAIEMFGEVNLTANQKFYIKKTVDGENKYNNFSALDLIASNFSKDGSYIKATEGGKFEFYFDFDGKSLYITDPAVAAADEWAQTFIAGDCATTKTNWTTHATSYGNLSTDAKALFTAVASGGNESGSYIEQAVARYDLVEIRYGKTAYAEFMGREAAGKLNPKASNVSIMGLDNNESNTAIIIITISTISLIGLGAFFFIKRKKEN